MKKKKKKTEASPESAISDGVQAPDVQEEEQIDITNDIPNFGQQDEPELQLRKKRKWMLPVIAAGIVVVASVSGYFIYNNHLNKKVELAGEALASGNFEDAQAIYISLNGKRDSSQLLEVTNALITLKDSDNAKDGISALLSTGVAVDITYNLNGGEFLNEDRQTEVTLTSVSEFADLYKAKKQYYDFVGWEPARIVYNPLYDTTVVDVSLKASFEPTVYSISYTNLLGGESDNPNEYTYESETFTIVPPTRTGYSFQYWSGSDVAGTPDSIMIEQGSNGNKAYIANWEPNKYMVTLIPDAEYDIDTEFEFTYDNDYALPEVEKRGYTYKGWGTGNSVYSTGVWQTAENISLSPVWELTNYNITYDFVGGSCGEKMPTTYTMLSDDIHIPNPSRAGYSFTGWTHAGSSSPKKDYVIVTDTVGDINFKATWLGNPHKITLNANGGTVSSSVVDVRFGSSYSLPTPERTGYTFNGWYSGSVKYSGGTWSADSDAKVTASWTAKKYSIKLDAAGGSCSSTNVSVTYDAGYSLPTPKRTGYTFQGWYYNGVSMGSGSWKIDGDVTLTAQWKGNEYTVSLKAGSGTVSPLSVSVIYGSSYTLPTPTRAGYDFTGWTNGSSIVSTSGIWSIASSVSLSAGWELRTYYITLDANGGTCSSSEIAIRYGDSLSLPTPTRTGYTFDGWYNGSSEVSSYFSTWKTCEDETYTAHWTGKLSNVYFNCNGGAGVSSYSASSYRYGDSYSLPTPTKTGYTFSGWYYGGTAVPQSGTWNIADSSVTLKAEWSVASYTIYLDANGGSVPYSSVTVYYGEAYSLPDASMEGLVFTGWYSGSSKYSSFGTFKGAGDVYLTAQYSS